MWTAFFAFNVLTNAFQGNPEAEIGQVTIPANNFSALTTLVNRTEDATGGNYDSLDSPRGSTFSTADSLFRILSFHFDPNTAGATVEIGYGDDAVTDSVAPPTANQVVFSQTLSGTASATTPVFIPIPRNTVPYARVSGVATWNLSVEAWTGSTGVADAIASVIGYETIQDEGTAQTMRRIVNFIGAGVTCVDNAANLRTNCTISGGGGSGVDVQEDGGVAFTAATLNFLSGLDITENPAGTAEITLDYAEDPVDLATGDVTGTLAAANGGTGQTAATADGSLIGDGSAFAVRVIPDCDTTGAALNFDQTTDAWACATQFAGTQIDLTTEVTGTLPAGNGGTGQTAATADAVLVANGTAYVARVVADCDAVGQAVNFDQTTDAWSCRTIVGSGANPTVSADGELAVDTTDDQFIYFSTAERVIRYQFPKAFTIELPADVDNFLLWTDQDALTVVSFSCIVDPGDAGESVAITIQERDSDGTNPTTIGTATCDNDGAAGSISDANVDAADYVGIDIGTVTGTVTQLNVTIWVMIVRE
jgi:hypothetical protein